MHPVISVRRARKIAALQADIDRLRTTIAGALNTLDELEIELHRLARVRHNHLTRTALTVLRRSPKPLPIRAITLAVMAAQEIDVSVPKDVERMTDRLRLLLRRQEKAGVVVKAKGKEPEERLVWRIA